LKEAARHYMLASFGGLPHARYNLAFLYERGAGVLKQSTDRCLQLLDAAAEAGHGGAASALAERLFKGVIRDRATEVEDFPEEAIYYWLLAAKEVNMSRESVLCIECVHRLFPFLSPFFLNLSCEKRMHIYHAHVLDKRPSLINTPTQFFFLSFFLQLKRVCLEPPWH
jgi:TPR repeat protein